MVVPMLAPKIIPKASGKFISPAPTKPTTATVVALDDCNMAVVAAPVIAPDNGLRVKRIKTDRMAPPANARSPSVMTIMPSRNRPSPPIA